MALLRVSFVKLSDVALRHHDRGDPVISNATIPQVLLLVRGPDLAIVASMFERGGIAPAVSCGEDSDGTMLPVVVRLELNARNLIAHMLAQAMDSHVPRAATDVVLGVVLANSFVPLSIAERDLGCFAALKRFSCVVEAVVLEDVDFVMLTLVTELFPAAIKVRLTVQVAAIIVREV